MNIIQVVNLHNYPRPQFVANRGTYIGRASTYGAHPYAESVLSNPFIIDDHSHTRARVLELYEEWIVKQMKTDTPARREIMRLQNVLTHESVLVLGCWCFPLPCHGDVVSKFIRNEK